MMKQCLFAVAASAALALCTATNFAATATVPQPADPITRQITSKDSAQIDQAVATISQQLQAPVGHDRRVVVMGLTRTQHWLKALMDAQRYDDVVRLSLEGTLAVPWDVSLIESLQNYRVQALLSLGKPADALGAAKGLFNVCRMQSTASDLLIIVNCLKAAYPGNSAIIDQLRHEQTAGATLTDQSPAASSQQSVLSGIKVDGSPYAASIQQYSGGDYGSLVSLGNLQLLADRATDAQPVFKRAYAVAKDAQLAEATESVARCMKAEDGAIGRANAWVLSIRPAVPITQNQ